MKNLLILTTFIVATTQVHAKIEIPKDEPTKPKKKIVAKQRINCNMTVKYLKRPKRVDELSDFLTKGIFYARFRTNTFLFDAGSAGKDHYSVGVGGNVIYKSARYKSFAFTTGLYGSQNIANAKADEIGDYRYGKDTFSRYALEKEGRNGMLALTQNYLSFKKNLVEVKVGRFMVESFMMQSHDTKMIPVSFQGAQLKIRTIPKTQIQAGYLTKQKLRDHERFHRVLAYNDDTSTPYAKWLENDDGSMHRGLTVSKLDAKGIDDHIEFFEVKNRTIKDTLLRLGYTVVPDLVSSSVIEIAHKFKFGNGLRIKPAIRYMQQYDEGGGAIGGANLRTDTRGYSDVNSLSNTLKLARLDFIYKKASFRVGYSKVGEGGDIIAPWHAQPTNGYTRPMSGMNWYANTETTMFRADYDVPTTLVDGLHIMSRYAMNNFDDRKPGVTADSNVFTLDLIKRFPDNPNLFLKLRSIMVKEDHKVANLDGSYKIDPTYNALRLEMDYFF